MDGWREGFCERLEAAKAAAGMSDEAIAIEIGRERKAVSRWRHGEGYPDARMTCKLCKALGVSADWLLGLEG